MTTIVTRAGKGSALTHNEVDSNFINLNNAKYESGNNATFGTVGATAITGTSFSNSGNLTFTGTGNRIIGDFSNGTIASRVAFQTSTTNSNTALVTIPNGTATFSGWQFVNNSDPTNGSFLQVGASSSVVGIVSSYFGTGSFLPMTFTTGGLERMRIDSFGNVGIGTSSPAAPLNVASSTTLSAGNPSILLQGSSNTERIQIRSSFSGGGQAVTLLAGSNGTTASPTAITNQQSLGYYQLGGYDGSIWQRAAWITGNAEENWTTTNRGSSLIFATTPIGSTSIAERMRIDSNGNVGIGVAPYDSNVGLAVYRSQNSLLYQDVQNPNTGAGAGAIFRLISSNAAGSGTTSADFVKYKTGPLIINNNETNSAAYTSFGVGASERMRIDSNGNVCIGISTASSKLHVNGGEIRVSNADYGRVMFQRGSSALWEVGPRNTDDLYVRRETGAGNVIFEGGNVGIGTSSPSSKLEVNGTVRVNGARTSLFANSEPYALQLNYSTGAADGPFIGSPSANTFVVSNSGGTERMRIDSSGNVIIGKTSNDFTVAGAYFSNNELVVTRNAAVPLSVNRLTDDGTLVQFFQANVLEGSISVSGTTVSYNGGHLSRWSQLYNETTQVEVYRGTVLESVDAMCEWYDEEGNLLSNEQATKTIVSTTPASKAVAGVFDRYDEDDEDNPYDFYVAQSGDFVIRVAAGTVVQNGDLLESAGDGTARVQADDICRSSTIAKVTSNYVSETYADGSFCVPCILMIG